MKKFGLMSMVAGAMTAAVIGFAGPAQADQSGFGFGGSGRLTGFLRNASSTMPFGVGSICRLTPFALASAASTPVYSMIAANVSPCNHLCFS